jgi:hypothetical protein
MFIYSSLKSIFLAGDVAVSAVDGQEATVLASEKMNVVGGRTKFRFSMYRVAVL